MVCGVNISCRLGQHLRSLCVNSWFHLGNFLANYGKPKSSTIKPSIWRPCHTTFIFYIILSSQSWSHPIFLHSNGDGGNMWKRPWVYHIKPLFQTNRWMIRTDWRWRNFADFFARMSGECIDCVAKESPVGWWWLSKMNWVASDRPFRAACEMTVEGCLLIPVWERPSECLLVKAAFEMCSISHV